MIGWYTVTLSTFRTTMHAINDTNERTHSAIVGRARICLLEQRQPLSSIIHRELVNNSLAFKHESLLQSTRQVSWRFTFFRLSIHEVLDLDKPHCIRLQMVICLRFRLDDFKLMSRRLRKTEKGIFYNIFREVRTIQNSVLGYQTTR